MKQAGNIIYIRSRSYVTKKCIPFDVSLFEAEEDWPRSSCSRYWKCIQTDLQIKKFVLDRNYRLFFTISILQASVEVYTKTVESKSFWGMQFTDFLCTIASNLKFVFSSTPSIERCIKITKRSSFLKYKIILCFL